MAAIPPYPRFPIPNPSSGVTPSHLITVASALHLGDLLHLRTKHHLHLLLCSSFQESYHSKYLPRIKDIWYQRSYSIKRNPLLQTIADAFSASCSSCFSFFSGKEYEKGFAGKGKLQFGTPQGSPFNRRLWTNVLLTVNVLVYVAQIASQGKLLLWGAKVNSLINEGELWRLATSSFLHANIGHLMVNCYSLNSVGPTAEQLSGPRRFLAVYLTSAIASSAMSYQFCQSPAVGASGAIFGLVGSFAVFVLRHRSLFGGGKQEMQQIAHVIALNMVIGLLSKGIDNWGHLGGFLGGVAVSWFLGPEWRYESKSDDGKLVFTDRAPLSHFINKRRVH